MNCPNCGEKPVGKFHSFRFGDIDLKGNLKGKFKCRNCGTMLRQEWSSMFIPRYRKPYWWYFSIDMTLLIVLTILFMYLVIARDVNIWIAFISYLIPVIGLSLYMDEVRTRYWYLEVVGPEEEEKEAQAVVTTTGLVVLSLYALLAIFGVVWLHNYLEKFTHSTAMYGISALVYLAIVLTGAVYILKKFSKKETSRQDEATAQTN